MRDRNTSPCELYVFAADAPHSQTWVCVVLFIVLYPVAASNVLIGTSVTPALASHFFFYYYDIIDIIFFFHRQAHKIAGVFLVGGA